MTQWPWVSCSTICFWLMLTFRMLMVENSAFHITLNKMGEYLGEWINIQILPYRISLSLANLWILCNLSWSWAVPHPTIFALPCYFRVHYFLYYRHWSFIVLLPILMSLPSAQYQIFPCFNFVKGLVIIYSIEGAVCYCLWSYALVLHFLS